MCDFFRIGIIDGKNGMLIAATATATATALDCKHIPFWMNNDHKSHE